MGSGMRDLQRNTYYDAYFRQVTKYDEASQPNDADGLERYVSSFNMCNIIDEGIVDEDDFKNLVVYGGEGGRDKNTTETWINVTKNN